MILVKQCLKPKNIEMTCKGASIARVIGYFYPYYTPDYDGSSPSFNFFFFSIIIIYIFTFLHQNHALYKLKSIPQTHS